MERGFIKNKDNSLCWSCYHYPCCSYCWLWKLSKTITCCQRNSAGSLKYCRLPVGIQSLKQYSTIRHLCYKYSLSHCQIVKLQICLLQQLLNMLVICGTKQKLLLSPVMK